MLMFVNVGFPSTSFGVYQPYLVELNGVSHSGASLIVTTRALSSLITTFFVAAYYKKFNCRLGITIGTILTGIGFLLFAFSNNLIICCISAFVAGIGYSLGGASGMTILIKNWYKRHSSIAIAVATIGSSASGIILPVFVLFIIENFNLNISFMTQAIFSFVVALILYIAIRNYPEDLNIKAFGEEPDNEKSNDDLDILPSIGKMKYRLFICGIFLLGSIGLTGIMFISVHYSSTGSSAQVAATIVSVSSIFLCVGKFASGFFMDFFGTKKGTAITLIIWLCGFIGLCISPGTDDMFCYISSALFGWGASLTTVGIAKWSIDLSALKGIEKTVRDFQIAYAAGGLATGMLPGIIAEFTGNYIAFYFVSAIFVVVAGIIILWIYPSNSKQ